MRAGLMEGLIGAHNNMKLTDTTMSVYRMAKARKDKEVKDIEEGKEDQDSKDTNKEDGTEITQNNHGDTLVISGEGKELSQTLMTGNSETIVAAISTTTSADINIGETRVFDNKEIHVSLH